MHLITIYTMAQGEKNTNIGMFALFNAKHFLLQKTHHFQRREKKKMLKIKHLLLL